MSKHIKVSILIWLLMLSGCNRDKASCVERRMTKSKDGCGGYVYDGMTYEQAREVCGVK